MSMSVVLHQKVVVVVVSRGKLLQHGHNENTHLARGDLKLCSACNCVCNPPSFRSDARLAHEEIVRKFVNTLDVASCTVQVRAICKEMPGRSVGCVAQRANSFFLVVSVTPGRCAARTSSPDVQKLALFGGE